MTPSDSPHARMFDLCQDHMATIVLERLVYWWPRGTRRRLSEEEWLCKPRQQLAIECRMSEMECRRALEKLKAKHLIETTVAKWSGSRGPLMHFRLLPRAMVLFEKRVRGGDTGAQGVENTSPDKNSVMGKIAQDLDHMGGMFSKNPYGLSEDNPPEFLDAGALPSEKVSGKNGDGKHEGGSLPKKGNMMAGGYGNSSPKKSTPKAPSAAKAAMQAKLGMSATAILAAKKVDGVFPGACR